MYERAKLWRVPLGGAEVVVVLIVGMFTIVPLVLGVWTAIDAGSLPDWAFERAGTSKSLWIVLPLVGLAACGLVTIVAAVLWFATYKPRVLAARDAMGPPPGPMTPPPRSW